MANTDGAEADQDLEAPDVELDGSDEALLHFAKFSEARRAVPWEQWTFREKANFYIDRVFLGFLVLFLLMFLAEGSYKMWYVTNVRLIAEYVANSVISVFDWLFTQEKHEEMFEL